MRRKVKQCLLVLVSGASLLQVTSCMVDQETVDAIATLTTEAVQAGLTTYLELSQQAQAME